MAENSPNVHYCDVNAIFEKLADRGYGWDDLFVDIQHPSFTGHVAIALGFLAKIAELEPLKNLSSPAAHVDFDNLDLPSLVSFYRQQLQISPLDEMRTVFDRICWLHAASEMSAYPEDFFQEAEKNLLLYRTKYHGSAEGQRYQAKAEALVQGKRAWLVSAHTSMGDSLAGAGKFDEAIEHYRQALRLDPNCTDAHKHLAVALGRAGKPEEVIEHFQQAVRLKPDSADAHNNLGVALSRAGNTGDAMEHFQQAVRLQPEHADAHNNLAVALAQAGKTDEAIEHFREVLRLKPDHADAHNNLAVALAQAGKSNEAIEHFREVLRLKPDHVDARHNLGLALAQAGKTDEAIEHFKQALRVQPNDAKGLYNLGSSLATRNRIDEAVNCFSRLLEIIPNHVESHTCLAWLLATHDPAAGGDPSRAVQLAQRARELAGQENPQCLDTLAAAYAAAGRFDDAVMTAERAIQLAESAGQTALAKNIQARLELYRAGRPYREAPRPATRTDR